MESYESVILVKNEVFVFKIPPKTSNRGYRYVYFFFCIAGNCFVRNDKTVGVFRAADWNLQEPQWTGRMRLVAKSEELIMKLEDKNSGELFAKCPIDKYPGLALESVTDSSRYFVVRIQDDNGKRIINILFSNKTD